MDVKIEKWLERHRKTSVPVEKNEYNNDIYNYIICKKETKYNDELYDRCYTLLSGLPELIVHEKGRELIEYLLSRR